jgi:hypothetical protein
METSIKLTSILFDKTSFLKQLRKAKKVFGSVKMNDDLERYVELVKSDLIQRVLCDYDETTYSVNVKTFERKGAKTIQFIYVN